MGEYTGEVEKMLWRAGKVANLGYFGI